jgi:hypothetical protein
MGTSQLLYQSKISKYSAVGNREDGGKRVN